LILAAIDIGSNAARLLLYEVVEKGKKAEFNRLNLIRIPLRLGFDVFEKGFIGGKKRKMLMDTIKAYKQLMKVYNVDHYMACATSAMRDAENGKEIIKDIQTETSIEIEIISGELEAEIIYENHIAELLDPNKRYLYIDVGGGSTELTLFENAEVKIQKSFNIGTVRMLTGKVKSETWNELKETLKIMGKSNKDLIGIGSGGNINKVIALIGQQHEDQLSSNDINDLYLNMEPMSVPERMHQYNIKQDRAEVIIPALDIYTKILKWANIDKVYVPKIGLADGLIHHLYDQISAK